MTVHITEKGFEIGLILFFEGERYTIGVGKVNPGDSLRREIIHQLCIQPMSHSELTKALTEDVSVIFILSSSM